MSTEHLVRSALEDSVKDVPCPEPDLEQLLASGRAMRRRRIGATASLAVAAVLVLVLAGLSFTWTGRDDRTLEPMPATPSPTPAESMAFPAELHRWIDALPAGPPPTTPYWHDGILHVGGAEMAHPYDPTSIEVAGRTVLVGGYPGEAAGGATLRQWAIVRGERLEPIAMPGPGPNSRPRLSADGRVAYWLSRDTAADTTRLFTWDTETNTALATRSVPGTTAMLLGVDADGQAYWEDGSPLGPVTRWDVRADTIQPTEFLWASGTSPEEFDGSAPWVNPADAFRSPDGTRTLATEALPSDSPSDCCDQQVRVRPVGPADSVAPDDVSTLALFAAHPDVGYFLQFGGHELAWWESDDSVLITVTSDQYTYLLRCSATGDTCERVAALGPDPTPNDDLPGDWVERWRFARAPVSP